MIYVILFLCLVLMFTLYFKPWIYLYAEDRRIPIQTEIRLRKAGKLRQTPLSHYTYKELMAIEKELRDIKWKRKMDYRLLPAERSLIKRFPFSYRLIGKVSSRKGRRGMLEVHRAL